MLKNIRLFLFSCWLLFLQPLSALELIESFHSDIVVREDGSLIVTETIDVQAEGYKIKRGIYRDFPTTYFGRWLTRTNVGFEVISVTRNGESEPFHSEDLKNGIRVYIGSSGRNISKGKHRYVIQYYTDRQLGLFEDYDELYWNVTGTGWDFQILKASASVTFPGDANKRVIKQEGWTGYQGQSGQSYRINNTAETIGFETRGLLLPNQGLTIGVQIPKGYVADTESQWQRFVQDNFRWLLAVLTFVGMLAFYVLSWHRVGRDPEPGVIMPLFNPPDGLSPAAMRFILDEKADKKSFSAAMINMAVKGYVDIDQSGKKKYTFNKLDAQEGKTREKLSPGERLIYNKLFSSGRKKITISKKYNSTIKHALKKHLKSLRDEYRDACFKNNAIYGFLGIALSLFSVMLLVSHQSDLEAGNIFVGMFIGLVVSVFIFILIMIFRSNLVFGLVVVAQMSLAGFANLFSGGILNQTVILIVAAMIGINWLFIYLLKAPTPHGRALMDKIEGFKLYLSTAEQDRLDILNPPERTPERFEKLLPYALALGVENQWSEQFADVLQKQADEQGTAYSPGWYHGNRFDIHNPAGSFTALSSGLSSTVASASVPPSSSSSGGFSSGGGFSGGGGGGGGGGGW
ncbi:DUF2207 domain-containing protein [Marinicella sp. W31]|uniref:DUF2207 domain-containing protein n=1 Tax=Marinicella sp. W31 TaxID=3023713 RepID=UPI00375832DE